MENNTRLRLQQSGFFFVEEGPSVEINLFNYWKQVGEKVIWTSLKEEIDIPRETFSEELDENFSRFDLEDIVVFKSKTEYIIFDAKKELK